MRLVDCVGIRSLEIAVAIIEAIAGEV